MTRNLIFLLLAILSCNHAFGNNQEKELEQVVTDVQVRQERMEKEIKGVNMLLKRNQADIQSLEANNDSLKNQVDSLNDVCDDLEKTLEEERGIVNGKFNDTNLLISSNKSDISSRTTWGVVLLGVLIILIVVSYCYMQKRIKKGSDTIDEVSKAQEALKAAQTKIEEESIKLDNKLLEIAEQQMNAPVVNNKTEEVDHSLAKKVADEIVRIELNLSRMDSSIKGYKQLSKAVQRIKDNFLANGYEIVDMLGKPYNEGMRVKASFIMDDTLKEGAQIITNISKPQINYNGIIIQKAEITVSQNI